jgi:hypothetical protein
MQHRHFLWEGLQEYQYASRRRWRIGRGLTERLLKRLESHLGIDIVEQGNDGLSSNPLIHSGGLVWFGIGGEGSQTGRCRWRVFLWLDVGRMLYLTPWYQGNTLTRITIIDHEKVPRGES